MNATSQHGDTIVVIGSGLAGLACARALRAAGISARILDKGRAPGGRAATRVSRSGPTFHHGAPYLNGAGPGFVAAMAAATRHGAAAPWDARAEGAWVGTPDMAALMAHLAADLAPRQTAEITRIEEHAHGVTLWLGEERIDADRVALTVPAPQARRLMAHDPALIAALAGVEMAPCQTLMVVWPEAAAPDGAHDGAPDFAPDGAHDGAPWAGLAPIHAVAPFARIIRAAGRGALVAHADARWSRENLERPSEDICADLLAHLAAGLGIDAPPLFARAHRWRHARVAVALGAPCIRSSGGRVILGGDWCLGPNAGDAWESGEALAHALIAR